MSKPVIGLVLGSGAARGLSHIGILDVLAKEGIKPDVVAGCSIGAFVGAAYLTGQLDRTRKWAENLTWRSLAGLMDVSLTGGGVISGEVIERVLQELGIGGNFEDLDRPFATVATDYITGREEWHRTGPIVQAVRASVALPGILTPTKIGNSWYVDGGLVNPVPISTCRALGANFIIAVNLNGDLVGRRKPPANAEETNAERRETVDQVVSVLPNSWREGAAQSIFEFLKPDAETPAYFDVLANSLNIMQDRITRSRLAGEPPHVLMTPRLASMGPFDFVDAKMAIEEGRRCAKHAIPQIRRLLATY